MNTIERTVEARFSHLNDSDRAQAVGAYAEKLTLEASEIMDASMKRKLTFDEKERARTIAEYFDIAGAGYGPDPTSSALTEALDRDRHRAEPKTRKTRKTRKPQTAAELRDHLQTLGYSRREAARIAKGM